MFMHVKRTILLRNWRSDKISVYPFPKDKTEKEKWIKAVPNANLRVTRDTVVCELH